MVPQRVDVNVKASAGKGEDQVAGISAALGRTIDWLRDKVSLVFNLGLIGTAMYLVARDEDGRNAVQSLAMIGGRLVHRGAEEVRTVADSAFTWTEERYHDMRNALASALIALAALFYAANLVAASVGLWPLKVSLNAINMFLVAWTVIEFLTRWLPYLFAIGTLVQAITPTASPEGKNLPYLVGYFVGKSLQSAWNGVEWILEVWRWCWKFIFYFAATLLYFNLVPFHRNPWVVFALQPIIFIFLGASFGWKGHERSSVRAAIVWFCGLMLLAAPLYMMFYYELYMPLAGLSPFLLLQPEYWQMQGKSGVEITAAIQQYKVQLAAKALLVGILVLLGVLAVRLGQPKEEVDSRHRHLPIHPVHRAPSTMHRPGDAFFGIVLVGILVLMVMWAFFKFEPFAKIHPIPTSEIGPAFNRSVGVEVLLAQKVGDGAVPEQAADVQKLDANRWLVSMPAGAGWYATGIFPEPGDTVRIRVGRGTYYVIMDDGSLFELTVAGMRKGTTFWRPKDGNPFKTRSEEYIRAERRVGELLARVGSSNPQPVGYGADLSLKRNPVTGMQGRRELKLALNLPQEPELDRDGDGFPDPTYQGAIDLEVEIIHAR